MYHFIRSTVDLECLTITESHTFGKKRGLGIHGVVVAALCTQYAPCHTRTGKCMTNYVHTFLLKKIYILEAQVFTLFSVFFSLSTWVSVAHKHNKLGSCLDVDNTHTITVHNLVHIIM